LGTRAYPCATHFFEGELEIDANLSFIDESGLGAYRCAIRMGGAVVATANLKVFEPEDFEQFLNAQIFNASMGAS
jgi:predicted hotdog family 3-hydroxylacyl-ACP dehydratase